MRKKIYITIDDAPSENTKEKLDFLLENNISVIWFLRGVHVEKHLEETVYLIANDAILGNHSYSHPYFSKISIESAKEEILKTEKLINNAYKKANKIRKNKLFRFPFMDRGDVNEKILQTFLKDQGFEKLEFENINYNYFQNNKLGDFIDAPWTFDMKDYALLSNKYMKKHNLYDVKDFIKRMEIDDVENGFGLQSNNSSDIVLFHDFATEIEIFIPVLEFLINKNCEFCLPKGIKL